MHIDLIWKKKLLHDCVQAANTERASEAENLGLNGLRCVFFSSTL